MSPVRRKWSERVTGDGRSAHHEARAPLPPSHTFNYGVFLNDLVSFVLVAAAVYYIVVVPVNKLAERRSAGAAPETKNCRECLGSIPYQAGKYMFCGSQQITIVEQPSPTAR